MSYLSYFGSHWSLFLIVVLAVIALIALTFVLKNIWCLFGAVALVIFGLAYQASNIDGYKRAIDEQKAAQITLLQDRIATLSLVSQMDTQRAVADATLNRTLKDLASATPRNDGPCLDAAAAHRVWAIGGPLSLKPTLPARRVPNVLPWSFLRSRQSPNSG